MNGMFIGLRTIDVDDYHVQAPFKSLFSANPANLDKLVTQRRLVMETLEDDGDNSFTACLATC